MFSSRMARAREGGAGGSNGTAENKGPKGFFRCSRVSVPTRKVVAWVGMGLCILAGGRRLLGFSSAGARPLLRGTSETRGVGEVLPSVETPYCSAVLDYPVTKRPAGWNANTNEPSNLELRQLQVTIRHGDRSAIHDIPGADEQKWRCLPLSKEVEQTWKGVSRFSVANVDGRPLERSFTPGVYAATELGEAFEGQEGLCTPGQLTEVGIRQHLTLGERMRQGYAALLGGALEQDEIYVRSTDYTRTLESAAAFLMAFFPGSDSMTIVTDEDESDEVMHGVGLKTSSKGVTGGPEKTVVGACDRATALSKTQNGGFKPRADVVSELGGLFGEEIMSRKMTEVADSLHARSCHNMTLPCSDKGCVSPLLALSVMSEADRLMCMRYVGAAGGMEASALSLYPFTNEILTNMRDVLNGDSGTKFALFSGHDTVIAPVLAALGAYDCRWPPYASHIVFELWSKPGEQDTSTSNADKDPRKAMRGLVAEGKAEDGEDTEGREGEDAPNTQMAGDTNSASAEGVPATREEGRPAGGEGVAVRESSKAQEDGEEGDDDAYVRIIFNGQPVTHRITDCRDLDGEYGRDFCPLSAFSKTIGRAIAPHKTLDEACLAFDDRHKL